MKIFQVNVLTDQSNKKEEVIAQAESLLADANEEVRILLSVGRLIPADLLKREISHLQTRVQALKDANTEVVIRGLELDIKVLSVKLNADIHLLGFKPSSTTPSPTSATTKSATAPPTEPTGATTRARSTSASTTHTTGRSTAETVHTAAPTSKTTHK